MRIELTTKPWQGLVLPLAPYPHHVCIIYAFYSTVNQYFGILGTSNRSRTGTLKRQILSLLGLPIPPYSQFGPA